MIALLECAFFVWWCIRWHKKFFGGLSMANPLIGITCGEDYAMDNYFLRHYYVKVVEAAGGVPILLPPVSRNFARETYLSTIDALILSGGVDVDPVFFGEEPIKGMGEITPIRDQFEITFIKEFYNQKKPILAICRGVQVLNIALGGTIYQDINSQLENCLKHSQQAPKWYATHDVNLVTGTKLSKISSQKEWRVNSFHHQAVRQPAPGFVVSARAKDGIIEAIESRTHKFALGVQWHPECTWENDTGSFLLFKALIAACDGK